MEANRGNQTKGEYRMVPKETEVKEHALNLLNDLLVGIEARKDEYAQLWQTTRIWHHQSAAGEKYRLLEGHAKDVKKAIEKLNEVD